MFRSVDPGALGIKADFEEALRYGKLGGFEGLDGSLTGMADTVQELGLERVKARYAEAGLRAGGLGLPMAWRQDEEGFKSFLANLPKIAATAADLGASGCMTWLSPLSPTLRFRENFQFHVARLRPIAEILADHGLGLGIEPVGPRTSREREGFGFIYTIYGALGLAEALGENVGLLLDSWHWYTGLGTVADLASLTARDVVHVHINDAPQGIAIPDQIDNQRALPGETGVIDLKTFLIKLKDLGYAGAVTPEPFSARVNALPAEQAISETGAALKQVWESAGI